MAWEELKGAVIEVANEVCRMSRRKRGAKEQSGGMRMCKKQ